MDDFKVGFITVDKIAAGNICNKVMDNILRYRETLRVGRIKNFMHRPSILEKIFFIKKKPYLNNIEEVMAYMSENVDIDWPTHDYRYNDDIFEDIYKSARTILSCIEYSGNTFYIKMEEWQSIMSIYSWEEGGKYLKETI